ncbi:MAG: cbb3-type cytochrome oxidase assembly protein CcoS [Porticoccus sp.]|nr:cbb3-type cytochrome oxidase assembly protein CcoS [Porticoccus sp.]
MASLYLLIPVSLIFCTLAVAIFFWAVNSGQYDDLDGEGERLLFSDDVLDSPDCGDDHDEVSARAESSNNQKIEETLGEESVDAGNSCDETAIDKGSSTDG